MATFLCDGHWRFQLGDARRKVTKLIQIFQKKVLGCSVNTPWYIRNEDIHRDLKTASVKDEVEPFSMKHERPLHKHRNFEMLQILDNTELVRRLNRIELFDLV